MLRSFTAAAAAAAVAAARKQDKLPILWRHFKFFDGFKVFNSTGILFLPSNGAESYGHSLLPLNTNSRHLYIFIFTWLSTKQNLCRHVVFSRKCCFVDKVLVGDSTIGHIGMLLVPSLNMLRRHLMCTRIRLLSRLRHN